MTETRTSSEDGPRTKADTAGKSKKPDARGKTAVLAIVLAVVLIAASVVLLSRLTQGDPWSGLCLDSMEDLPAEIPERLIVDTMTEVRARFVGTIRLTVEGVLRGAIGTYGLPNRLVPVLEENQTESQPGDHRMELRVYLREGIFAAGGGGFVPGRMCGNVVFVQLMDNLDQSRLVLIHELGHFLGLYHERATYMGHPLCPETHGERFSARQMEILDRWNEPGTPYVRHWDQMKADGTESFGCPVFLAPAWFAAIGLTALGFIVVAAYFIQLRKRRKTPGP